MTAAAPRSSLLTPRGEEVEHVDLGVVTPGTPAGDERLQSPAVLHFRCRNSHTALVRRVLAFWSSLLVQPSPTRPWREAASRTFTTLMILGLMFAALLIVCRPPSQPTVPWSPKPALVHVAPSAPSPR